MWTSVFQIIIKHFYYHYHLFVSSPNPPPPPRPTPYFLISLTFSFYFLNVIFNKDFFNKQKYKRNRICAINFDHNKPQCQN